MMCVCGFVFLPQKRYKNQHGLLPPYCPVALYVYNECKSFCQIWMCFHRGRGMDLIGNTSLVSDNEVDIGLPTVRVSALGGWI